ncbi:MAG: LysR family transcriptional regulator [Blastocatellia bacterium]|nr:LysR family transcriptional regulator [Blastocatellia bacterium]
MDLDRLGGFLTFARALNFSAAARQMNISQPALHGQVRQLEHELGVKLYTRDAGRLQLTEQGRSLLLFGQNLLDEVTRFETDLRGEPQTEELRLGAGLTATLYLLPGPLRDFRALWPDVECRVGVHHRADVLSLVRSAELDLGVTSIERTPADLESFVCARTRHALIVPTGHPLAGGRKLTLADIAEHPLVLPRAGLQHRRMIDDAFRKAGVEYRAALETEGWEVMKHYVALGFGIAIVNDLCLAHSVPPEIVSARCTSSSPSAFTAPSGPRSASFRSRRAGSRHICANATHGQAHES